MLISVVLTGSCIRVISRDERSREVARGYEILRFKVVKARALTSRLVEIRQHVGGVANVCSPAIFLGAVAVLSNGPFASQVDVRVLSYSKDGRKFLQPEGFKATEVSSPACCF